MIKRYAFMAAERAGKLDYVRSLAIENRIREKYSISDEFAIQRQRDKKPEKFAEYYAFCEQVIAEVDAEIERQREEYKNKTNIEK